MSTGQSYVGRANNVPTNEQTAENSSQTAKNEAQVPSQLTNESIGLISAISASSELTNFLANAPNLRQARTMLRSWFLSYTLQQADPVTSNSGDLADNVEFYELLDDFLNDIIFGTLPTEGQTSKEVSHV